MQNKKLIVVLMFGLILRLISSDQSLWLDEATSIKAAQMPLNDILTKFSPGDFHPPLYYLFLKGWGSIFGWGEVAVRTLSIVFGLATIPVIYRIGVLIKNQRLGLIASMILATSPLHIYYSQEARMYVLATFLSALTFLFFLKVLNTGKSSWVYLAASIVLLAFTDYLPIFFVVSLALYLYFFERKHLLENKRSWIKLFAFVLVLLSFWIPIFLSQVKTAKEAGQNASSWIQSLGKTGVKQLVLVPVKFMIGRISFYNKILYLLFIIPPSVLFGWSLFLAKSKVLWFVFLVPLFLSVTFGFFFSGFSYFRLIFLIPFFYLLVALGIESLESKKSSKYLLAGILLVNIIAVSVYFFNSRFHREDWKGAVSWVEESSKDKKAAGFFVVKSVMDPYNYYSRSVSGYSRFDNVDNLYDKIYLFRYAQAVFDQEDLLKKKIEILGYKKAQEKDFNGIVVWEYTK